jgi:cytochrome c oxidase cbb3-type subunit 3
MRAVVAVAGIAALLGSIAGCKREERSLRDEPAQRALFAAAREGDIVAGGKLPGVGMKSPAEGKAFAIAQGQQLFTWYNCAGCHGVHGGGGIGPPLTSDKLVYGSEPENIFDTIVKGRPRGMPSWGGRIPESQIWQLAAFVRSLSGKEPLNATAARSDNMETKTKAQLK